MSKTKIVQRLLDKGQINAEEAIQLLKEAPIVQHFGEKVLYPKVQEINQKVPYSTICGCAVCNCIMANKMVDPNNFGNSSWSTGGTTLNDNFTSK